MAVSPLRRILERGAGGEEFHYVIPHPFLPPRYQGISNNRNMILLMDRDLTLHIRWEGSRMHEHRPLTPKGTMKLLREVSKNMSEYRKELQILSRFIDSYGEAPFDDSRYELPIQNTEISIAKKREDVEAEALISITQPEQLYLELGGESPMGGGFDGF